MTEERWLPVVGYEGYYEVSDQGRVRSVERVIMRVDGTPVRRKGKILKLIPVPSQHRVVSLWRGGESTRPYIHQLVAEAFVPNPEGHPFVLHWDDDPSNNRVENLRWGTYANNASDALRNGRNFQANKTHCPRGHVLVEPNLAAYELARGMRKCLACQRAGAHSRNVLRVPLSQELADRYYMTIMTTTTTKAAA